MTGWEAIAATATRSCAVAVLCGWLAPHVAPLAKSNRVWTALAAAPFLTPGLMVGYVWRQVTIGHVGLASEAAYLAVLAAVTLPVATLAAMFAPPTADARAIALWRLARPTGRQSLRMAVARHRDQIAAGLVAALWAMQESEIGILMQAAGWPEWTQRQLQGARAAADLLGTLWPAVAIQVALLGVAFVTLRGRTGAVSTRRATIAARVAIVAAALVATAYPLGSILVEASRGVRGLSQQRGLVRTLAWSLTLAVAASAIAWPLVRGRLASLAAVGLLGSLLIAVGTQAAVAAVEPRLLGTPLPHLAALAASLLAKAAALRWAVAATRRPRAIRAAELAGASRAIFAIRERPRLFAFAVLVWSAYFDVMTASVLAAPGLETTPLQLYNFVHFGQIVTLAAWLLLAAAVPIAAGLLAASVLRRMC